MAVNRQVIEACKRNKLLPVLFVASCVTRLYYILFSTFWVLYLTSYVGTLLENDKQASDFPFARRLHAAFQVVSEKGRNDV